MQRLFTNIKFNTRAIISIMMIICLFALGFAFTAIMPQEQSNEQPIVAEAASTITASNFRSVIQNNGGGGTVSGDYVLESNITVDASKGVNIATFSGTFDGQGHTLTVNNNLNYTAGRNNDYYIGMIFGRLGGSSTVKNLNIVWNSYWNVLAYNNKSSASYSGEGSTTVYVGGLCGLASSGAKIENVSFTLGSTIAGIGIDDGTNHETQTGGQGAVVGAMIGRSQGAKLTNITFTNNGSVWARGHSVSGGSNHKGVTVSLSQPDTRGDRAAAGGMIGEIQSGATTINGLVFRGNGYVGAAATGSSSCVVNNSNTNHTINFAGGIVGFTYGGTLVIDGMLYEYTGKSYVKESVALGKNAGTIIGKGGGITINALWRRTDDNSSTSGIGTYSYYSSTSGPSKGGAAGLTIETTIGEKSVTSVAQGAASPSTNVYGTKEYKPTAYYSGNNVSFGTAVITDIKNGYLSIQTTSNDPAYLISALTYNMVNNGAFTTKNYYNVAQTTSALFSADQYQIPVKCNEFRLILATKQKSMYVSCGGNKTFDTLGISFKGAASETSGLLSDLYWVAEHDSNPAYNVIGELGSANITTHENVGTYTMVLYRKDTKTGESVKVQDGDSLGSNTKDAPSIIYQFDATAASNYRYTIYRAEVDLVPLSAAFVREYDGTPDVEGSDLTYNLHYGFYLAGTQTQPKTTPQFTIGSGKFYDSTGTLLDSSVGSNKVVKISGINVTGNYVLSASSGTTLELANCRITERTINYEWSNLNNQIYNGSIIRPSIQATNLVSGDSVNFTISVYSTMLDAINNNPILDRTGVRDGTQGASDYYIVRATIESNPNYIIENGYAEEHLYVLPKEIGLTWTAFEKTFEYADQVVTCVVTNSSSVIASGDVVGLQISYYHNEMGIVTSLRNAGTYTATATISNRNYYLNESTATFSNIRITPIALEVVFYTGEDYSSNVVQSLVYKGTTYIGDATGLHAKMAPNSIGKGLIDANIKLTYNGDVINAGTYVATASFVDSDENTNEDIIITNYSVSTQPQSLVITPREITLSFGQDVFEYDGRPHSVEATIADGKCGQDVITIRDEVYQRTESGDIKVTAVNANNYIVLYTLNNSNYKIRVADASHSLTITPYNIQQSGSKVKIDTISAVTYTGYDINPTITVRFDGTIMQSENYTIGINNNRVAGTANVTVTGKNNFSGALSTTFTINKATLTVKFNSPTSTQYNGTTQAINAEFEGYKGDDASTPVPMFIDYGGKEPKNCDTYTATVSFNGTPANYVLTSNEALTKFTFTITPKPISISITGYKDLIFNGKSHKYQAGVNEDGIKVSFKNPEEVYTGDNLGLNLVFRNDTTNTTQDPINAGSYTATASLTGGSIINYVISDSSTNPVKFEISKYQIAITYDLSTVKYVYDSKPKSAKFNISDTTPEIEGQSSNITLSYRNINSNTVIAGNPVNAGNYQIEPKIGNSNYSLATNQLQNFVISKAPLEVRFNIVNDGIYYYEAIKRTITYGFVAPNTTLGTDAFNLITTYYETSSGKVTADCINAGDYKVSVRLPNDNDTNVSTSTINIAKNYYLINADSDNSNTVSGYFSIKPRYISVQFDMNSADSYYYNNETRVVHASVGENNGIINDAGYYDISGLMLDDKLSAEKATFIVKMYKGTVIADEFLVDGFKDVGTYTATVAFDDKNPINSNYVIYDLNQAVYPTTTSIVIKPKDVIFKTSLLEKSISKTYGELDGDKLIIELNAQNTNNGIFVGDEMKIRLTRALGENAGSYIYTGFNFIKQVIVDDKITWEIVDASEANSNYNITYYGNDGENDKFIITKLNLEFEPNTFTFDYMQEITGLTQTLVIDADVPSINGTIVNINLNANSPTTIAGVNAGQYDLSDTNFTYTNSNNITLTMVAGSNEDKIIIKGRSVKVSLNLTDYRFEPSNPNDVAPFDQNSTFYITYGYYDEVKLSNKPNFISLISIDIDKCATDIQNATDFTEFIQITCEADGYSGYIPYKESGYNITINFLKNVSGEKVIDENYRAVIDYESGKDVAYKLFVQKWNLNKVFNPSDANFDDTTPEVQLTKDYDGTTKANFVKDAQNKLLTKIPALLASHTLDVTAEYDDANAGGNKTIYIIYDFKVDSYEANFILPGNNGKLQYSTDAEIKKVKINAFFGLGNYNLTYGQHYSANPSSEFEVEYPNIVYTGFVNGETAELVGIDTSIRYVQGLSTTPIESIMDAGQYTIALINNKTSYTNYEIYTKNVNNDEVIVNAGEIAATQTITINTREIYVTPGQEYIKTVDGSNRAYLTPANYVINGLIERDANTPNAVIINYNEEQTRLASNEPGKTTVKLEITGISGSRSANYSLPRDDSSNIIIIPAEIKELAIVKFDSNSYAFDFDNTAKNIVPSIEEGSVQSNAKYVIKYVGRCYDGKDYIEQISAPKSAGVYTVKCYFYLAENEQDASTHRMLASTQLVINKVLPTLHFIGNNTQTYGSFTPITAAVKAPGLEEAVEVQYSFANEDGSLPAFPPAGRHTVSAYFEETNDYLEVSAENTIQIKKKTIGVQFNGYKNLVYNGYVRNNDIKVTLTGVVEGDVCEPIKIFNVDEIKDAGTYNLMVNPSNNSYTISGLHSIEFTIAKKTVKVSTESNITTYAGIAPKITLLYDGFVENEGIEDIDQAPTPKITSGKVGVNIIEYNEGHDKNYTFTYVPGVYTIVYESPNKDKTNMTPYVIGGASVGGIALVFALAYFVKIGNYKAITRGVAKRKIRKEMIDKAIGGKKK